jgi:hypothetical protein
MKRSAQVALLFGGLTAAGAGAYAVTPARTDCAPPRPPAPGATTAPGVAAPQSGAAAETPAAAAARMKALSERASNPCDYPRRHWWYTSSGYDRYGNTYYRSRPIWGSSSSSRRTSSSTSVAAVPASRTSFGGFGRTGFSFGRSS